MMHFSRGIRGRYTVSMLLAAASVTCGAGAAIAANPPSDAEQVAANEHAWAKAALDGDADRMARLMADEYLELAWEPATLTAPAHWTATGKKEWVEAVRRRTEVYTSVELRNLTVHLQGASAAVTGEYSQTGTNAGKDNSASGIYADTWVKRNGRWLIIESVFP